MRSRSMTSEGAKDGPLSHSLTTTSAAHGPIALVGSPNSGKTTLFNWLTGSRFKVVNYPGSTVDYSIARTQKRFGPPVRVMDTPGTYSLVPRAPDEQVTYSAIFHHPEFGAAPLVISVVDATNLRRQLFVTRQLLTAGFRVVVAVTMIDLLRERGDDLDQAGLAQNLGCPVVVIDGRLGGGVQELVNLLREHQQAAEGVASLQPNPARVQWSPEQIEAVMRETAEIGTRFIVPFVSPVTAAKATPSGCATGTKKSAKRSTVERTRLWDRWLLHPVLGLMFFALIMTTLFSAVFWMATPLMDLVDGLFSSLQSAVGTLGLPTLLKEFLASGVIASAASVLVFVPQIFILFVGLNLLDDSGYLARSAALIDKPLSRLGLGGRSFVPLLSGFACAVPAMMAARNISSRRERWLTLFIIPLMSCSARLPVYALLITFLISPGEAWKGGLILAAIYLGSVVTGVIAARIANLFIKADESSIFAMEMPIYRRPRLRIVLRQALTRTNGYVRRAGPVIFVFAILMWVATTFPRYDIEDAGERLEASYAAQVGRYLEPVFEPMGGDWRTGAAILTSFAAREIFVSSLAVVFHVAEGEDDSINQSLIAQMRATTAPDGRPLFTVASVLGLIVFFMIALQCTSTVSISAREAGNWRFAIFQLIAFSAIAYALAVALVQGLRAIGIS